LLKRVTKIKTYFLSLLTSVVCAVAAEGVEIPAGSDAAHIEAVIGGVHSGGEVRFAVGVYPIDRAVRVMGKTNLVLRAAPGARFLLRFDPTDRARPGTDGFDFRHCADLRFEGGTFTTDRPVNCSGRVVSVDIPGRSYEVAVDAAFPITGRERLQGCDTFDAEGMPDYVIETYDNAPGSDGIRYELVAPQRIRVHPKDGVDLSRLDVGHAVLYRYWIYGNHVFRFASCSRVVLGGVSVERASSMVALVQPRCEDFTFERLCVRAPDGDRALFCCNADGIHVSGLRGTLTMRECLFRGLGDDALNVHNNAVEVRKYDAATGAADVIRVVASRVVRPDPLWVAAGDRVIVYDHATLRRKGTARVASWGDGKLLLSNATGPIAAGDMLANDAFNPSVRISRCVFENSRARGLLLRSCDMRVEDCVFRGHALPGLLIAPDAESWHEFGPSEHVLVADCLFEKCAMNGSRANAGAVSVKTSDDCGAGRRLSGVHKDVRILGNTFRRCGTRGVFVSAADGVVLRDNVFEDNRIPHDDAPGLADVRLENCTDCAQ